MVEMIAAVFWGILPIVVIAGFVLVVAAVSMLLLLARCTGTEIQIHFHKPNAEVNNNDEPL